MGRAKNKFATKCAENRDIQETSEKLIGFWEWGADFILGLDVLRPLACDGKDTC